jgi:hypothetical protein
MHKIVRIGSIQTWGGRWASIYCEITHTDKNLSILGVIGPTRGGNAMGGCGQIDMEFEHRSYWDNYSCYDKKYLIYPKDIKFAKGWDANTLYAFLEVWKNWHLNDTHAECIHQEELGWTYSDHPSAKCPFCGWKLGHGWSRREVPHLVLDFLKSLPDTDLDPAWV